MKKKSPLEWLDIVEKQLQINFTIDTIFKNHIL